MRLYRIFGRYLMKIKWIVLDMDGTLLYENKELPPTFFDVKKDLEALGIKFVLASGRQYARMRTVVQPYADDFIYITDNGTIVYEDGERILEVTIDNQLSQEIIQFTMDEMNTDHVINAVDAAYFLNGIDQEIESTFNEFYEVRKFVDDFTQVKDVVKISLFDLKDEFTGHEKLEKFSDSVNITHSGPTWLDIVSMHKVLGKRTHDARIAAVMITAAINHILTLNPSDFSNIPEMTVVHPESIVSAG